MRKKQSETKATIAKTTASSPSRAGRVKRTRDDSSLPPTEPPPAEPGIPVEAATGEPTTPTKTKRKRSPRKSASPTERETAGVLGTPPKSLRARRSKSERAAESGSAAAISPAKPVEPRPPQTPAASVPQKTAQMIAEKRATPLSMPVPQPPREPVAAAPWPGAQSTVTPATKTKEPLTPGPADKPPVARAASANRKFELPEILFEGDEAITPATGGPGHKFALGPASAEASQRSHSKSREPALTLPQRFGSGKLTLTARDPHSLFAHWDLSIDQQRGYLADAAVRHFSIRLRAQSLSGPVLTETVVQTESRHWFLHAPQAATSYVAELGYYFAPGEWISIASSGPATTPSDTFSQDRTVTLAQMPRASTAQEGPVARTHGTEGRQEGQDRQSTASSPPHIPQRVSEEYESRVPVFPGRAETLKASDTGFASQWTSAQERALDEIITAMNVRQEWFDSLQLVEMLEQRRGGRERIPAVAAKVPEGLLVQGPSSLELPGPERPLEAISSPFGAEEQKGGRDFWFNVNAELIIYGATEPSASVTIGGRPIKLRPDGTFSYRFALPDGQFDLPAEAVSVDDDRRRAELRFSRQTTYRGHVGAHPQDPNLKIPAAENVA
jgi:hypothetical protein